MESVGFTRAQAEAIAEELAKLIDERLATKGDVGLLRTDLTLEIKAARTDLMREIELLRRDMVIRLGSMMIASIAVVSTIVTFLSRLH